MESDFASLSYGQQAAAPSTARHWIEVLKLTPHPEGGHYREIFRSTAPVLPCDGRPTRSAITLIHFLLDANQTSAWHRVMSDETWHWSGGGPLDLWLLSPDFNQLQQITIGSPERDGIEPVAVVPAGWWQAARPHQTWSLVQCCVAPGFDFTDFSMLRDIPDALHTMQSLHPELLAAMG